MLRLDLDPDRKVLRQFSLVGIVGFLGLATMVYFGIGLFSRIPIDFRPGVAAVLLGASAWCLLAALAFPRLVFPLFVGLTVITFPVGWVVSYLILGTLFYLVLVPIGLIFRMIGRDALHRTLQKEVGTYWNELSGPRPKGDYFKQF